MKTYALFAILLLVTPWAYSQGLTDQIRHQRQTRNHLRNHRATPGDLLITSANRQLSGYLCYGISGGLMFYAAQKDDIYPETVTTLNLVAIGFYAAGTGLLISAAINKRRAGEKLNQLGLYLGTTSDGLTLSWAF